LGEEEAPGSIGKVLTFRIDPAWKQWDSDHDLRQCGGSWFKRPAEPVQWIFEWAQARERKTDE
jgi:hypothetical protein